MAQLLCDKAVVDHWLRTGDERRFVRSQEQHSVSHLYVPIRRKGVAAILSARSPGLVAFSIGGM